MVFIFAMALPLTVASSMTLTVDPRICSIRIITNQLRKLLRRLSLKSKHSNVLSSAKKRHFAYLHTILSRSNLFKQRFLMEEKSLLIEMAI
jgi:hypothetical protein